MIILRLMTTYEIFVFILCFIVFSLLTVMFSYLLATITKMELTLIKNGLRDKAILKELNTKKASSRVVLWVNRVLSFLLCLAVMAAFACALYIHASEGRPANGIPSIKVVKSDSMAWKEESNTYLYENGLDDQIQMFDLVICHHLPPEDELELYDIVVYKQDDMYVIHRIVGIEEPNEKHPNERHFLLKGDAVQWADKYPVLYGQMQGIYEGIRIPFVGSVVLFLQSPAGWLCVLLLVFSMIATPIVEKKLKKEKDQRIAILNAAEEESENEENKTCIEA